MSTVENSKPKSSWSIHKISELFDFSARKCDLKMNCNLSCVGSVVGYAVFGYIIYRTVQLVNQLMRPAKDLSKFGDYSVVTGATAGIGKSIAVELAKRGQNLILVGRSSSKLASVEEEIKGKYNKCEIVSLTIDLSKMSENDEKLYNDTISKYNVGILVNNAGLAYPYTQYFDEVGLDRVKNMVEVNCKAAMVLSHLTINSILSKKGNDKNNKNKGCIINISSAGSIVPHELHCVYSATKAALNKFTYDLGLEYNKRGIYCQVQLPYFVVSNMSKIRKATFTTPSSENYAKYSVNHMGYSGLLSPYPAHAMIFFVLNFVPTFVLEKVIGNMHHSIRKKGHKKFGFKKE